MVSEPALANAMQTSVNPNATKNKVTMIVLSGDLDKVFASLIIATGAAASGMEVTMFFTFWGLKAIQKGNLTGKSFFGKMLGMMNRNTIVTPWSVSTRLYCWWSRNCFPGNRSSRRISAPRVTAKKKKRGAKKTPPKPAGPDREELDLVVTESIRGVAEEVHGTEVCVFALVHTGEAETAEGKSTSARMQAGTRQGLRRWGGES